MYTFRILLQILPGGEIAGSFRDWRSGARPQGHSVAGLGSTLLCANNTAMRMCADRVGATQIYNVGSCKIRLPCGTASSNTLLHRGAGRASGACAVRTGFAGIWSIQEPDAAAQDGFAAGNSATNRGLIHERLFSFDSCRDILECIGRASICRFTKSDPKCIGRGDP